MLSVGVEPLVLQRLDLLGDIEVGQFIVEQVEQVLVVRHELVFAVGHVDWRQLEVVDEVAAHEPFQREGVVDDLSFFSGAD